MTFSSEEHCPKCGTDFQGKPIPEHQQYSYGGTHFSRKIARYSLETDRVEGWVCPDCSHQWKRV